MSETGLDEAQRLLDANQFDRAIDTAAVALVSGEDAARAKQIVGRGMQSKGLHPEALLWFDESLGVAPRADTLAYRGWSRYQRGENELALADYARAIALDPTLLVAIFSRGLAHEAANEHELARADFARAAEDPNYRGRALFRRGRSLLAAGEKDEAIADLTRAAEAGSAAAAGELRALRPDLDAWSNAALTALATHYATLQERDLEAEVAVRERALAKATSDDTRHEALMALGYCYRAAERFDNAVDAFGKAGLLRPKGPGLTNVGRTLYFAERNREAETTLEAAIAQGVDPYLANQTLGELYFEENRLEEALAAFDVAQAAPEASHGKPGRTQLFRGRVLLALGRKEEARAAFIAAERAGELSGVQLRREHFGNQTASDFLDLAANLMQNRCGPQAEGPLRQAASLFRAEMRAPGDFAARQLSNTLNNLAMVLRERGQVGEALEVLQEARRARPFGADPCVTMGNILLHEKGRKEEALAAYDCAVALRPGDPYVHYGRGGAHLALGHAREAAADYQKALAYQNASQRQDALFNMIKSLWKGGLFAEARAACDGVWVDEDLETATRRNIEALIDRRGPYEGNEMILRLSETLDLFLQDRAKPAANSHAFLFYGVAPHDWEEGANMGHVYRLRFAGAPEAKDRQVIAAALPALEFVEIGDWVWSGPFAQVVLGEKEPGEFSEPPDLEQEPFEFSEFFREVRELMLTIHEVAPLKEVVALNAKRTSGEDEPWEAWSLAMQPLPSAHPFKDDGSLFFSAYGDCSGQPEPSRDPSFNP